MRLYELIKEVAETSLPDMEITGLTSDTRAEVTEGSIFVCIKGNTFDGHDAAFDCVKNGAKVEQSNKSPKVEFQQYTIDEEAFDFIDNLEDLTLEKFGSRWDGHSYIIGSFPTLDILGDSHKVNVIFENSFDGSTPIRATYCMLRIMCQNQLSTVWRENPCVVKLMHTRSVVAKITQAKEIMANVQSYIKDYTASAEKLVGKRLNNKEIDQILTEYLKISEAESEKEQERLLDTKNNIIKLVDLEDHENFKGTAWGLVNSVTNYNSHRDPRRSSKEDWAQKRFFQNAQGSLYSLANLALAA